jgi:PQQ-dependent dehydrogenase (methanol/ethanol family)
LLVCFAIQHQLVLRLGRKTMRAVRKLGSLFVVGLLVLAGAVIVALAQQARQVDDDALASAGKTGEEWVSYNGNWTEQRYSPLNQINATNVSRLGLAFTTDLPSAAGNESRHEGTPLVYNGVLYSITPWSVVYAVDARTGKELWHQDPQVNQQVWRSRICCGVVNRGIAMYKDKIIAPVVDGRLRALDMKDGKVLWDVRVSPENMPYTITMAPRVIKGGRVIVGVSGGEYGVRGFFSAYDADTGTMAWRFYTVPGDPSKPFEDEAQAEAAKTWDQSKEWWKIGGGGGVWGGIAYDPDVDLVYVSTGQPAPWTSVWRGPGDNLYTDSIVAVRGATGKLVWHYQEVPGDDWDLDSIADLMLADLEINGKTRKVIMHAPKNGFFYVLDRRTGELLSADPWVSVSWAAGVNMKTGRPVINPEARYGTESAVTVMPGPGGGHVWPPMSFNPATGLVYIPSQTGQGYPGQAAANYTPAPTDIGPTGRGQMNMGTGRGGGGGRGGGAGGAGGGAGALAPGLDPAVAGGGARGAAPATTAPAAPAPAGGGAGGGGGRGGGGGGRGAGGGDGNAAAGAPAGPPQPSRMLFLTLDAAPMDPPAPAQPGGGGGRGGGGGGGGGGGRGGGVTLPVIGPTGQAGSFLIAWDPVAQKEKWRGPAGSAAGFNQGGTLATGGNLVFGIGGGGRLVAYRADNGQVLKEIALPLGSPGPPMTYLIDGKQYIVIAGGPQGGGRGGAGGGGRGQ